MATKYKDYPVYTYDEPATYEDFTGGINTDPSNEHLTKNELRDCINMTYQSGALVKRKGAKEIASLSSNIDLHNIQGIFLFTYRITYIVIAADGKLYYGIYNENTNIQLTRLRIYVNTDSSNRFYNPMNLFEGLEERYSENISNRHEGFIHSYELNNSRPYNYLGRLEDNPETIFKKDDVISWNGVKYKYINDISLTYDVSKQGSPAYNKTFWEQLREVKELIFQNYRKIEAATFNNKLYIATGTRFLNVELRNNVLYASPVEPYRCNNSELTLIGYNYLSPYPEYCRGTELNTVTTSIGGLLAVKTKTNSFILEPQMTFQSGDTPQDYYYRWEKKVGNQWYVIKTFKSQDPKNYTSSSDFTVPILNTLEVYDADRYLYRVTFAKAFDKESTYVEEWINKTTYKKGYFVTVGSTTYKCLEDHTPSYLGEDGYQVYTGKTSLGKDIIWDNAVGSFSTSGIVDDKEKIFWKVIHEQEAISILNEDGTVSMGYDYAIDKVTGEYFGSATSVLFTNIGINDTYNIIQTCTKVHVDGSKLLLYGDRYNSGKWFKTIINQPGYITDRGCLSFKTTKNEEIIKVVSFQGNIIVFANSENIGGSIHLVQGSGDDYDAQDGYYSPYRRSTINSSVSCDNPNTIQICDNLLLFKYFNRIYYINASELSNEVIQVTPCNDRILQKSKDVDIPWDDNTCISEVTNSYYGLIWKEKYEIDKTGELILKHPGMRVKMYYKMASQIQDDSYVMPWLRDESDYLNVEHCIYIKGKPIFLYNNILISFNEDVYSDLGHTYKTKLHFKAVDCGYPKMFKLLSNVLVYYHHNQYSKINFNIECLNEAGHLLLNSDKSTKTLQELKVLKADDTDNNYIRLDSTILDTKLINTTYKFPYLLVDTIITTENKEEFSLSSITYNYTTIETPDVNPYDLYSSVIRKKDLTKSSKFKGGH